MICSTILKKTARRNSCHRFSNPAESGEVEIIILASMRGGPVVPALSSAGTLLHGHHSIAASRYHSAHGSGRSHRLSRCRRAGARRECGGCGRDSHCVGGAIATLATLRRSQPDNAAVEQGWEGLLKSVGLERFSKVKLYSDMDNQTVSSKH